ncbi:MAG: phage holin family protein [Acidobacteriota bacterium]
MTRIVLQIALNGLALYLIAHLVPGIGHQGDLPTLLFAGLAIGLLNCLVKPFLTLFSLPLLIVTLGLFYLVINGLLLRLAAWLVPGFEVAGWLPAILGGAVLAVVNALIRGWSRKKSGAGGPS